MSPPPSSGLDAHALWARWIDLWNGDLAQLEEIIHPEFCRVGPGANPEEIRGREGLLGWITRTRIFFPDLRFSVEVGPIVEGATVAGRWVAEGTYQGGIPGATAPAGTRVRFRGNDIWRAEDGLIRDYWLSDDLLDLMQQVGAIPAS